MYLKIGTFFTPISRINKNNEQKINPLFCHMCLKMFISEANVATFVRLLYLNFKISPSITHDLVALDLSIICVLTPTMSHLTPCSPTELDMIR